MIKLILSIGKLENTCYMEYDSYDIDDDVDDINASNIEDANGIFNTLLKDNLDSPNITRAKLYLSVLDKTIELCSFKKINTHHKHDSKSRWIVDI